MVVVKIELWPGGNEEGKRRLGEIYIKNDGTGTELLGNYEYEISHAGKFIGRGIFKRGRVKGFLRKLSPYRLLFRILKDAGET